MYLNQNQPKTLKDKLRKIYRKIQSIFAQIDFVPSGHFYSPIANSKEIEEGIAKRKFDPALLYGIDLNLKAQLSLLEHFSKLYALLPFSEEKSPNLRYYFNNPAYCHSDGICLFSMLLYAKPKSIIEVGSGFSSALIHDVNERFFGADSTQRDVLMGGGITQTSVQTLCT